MIERHALLRFASTRKPCLFCMVGYQTVWVLFNLGRRDYDSAKIAQLLRDHFVLIETIDVPKQNWGNIPSAKQNRSVLPILTCLTQVS